MTVLVRMDRGFVWNMIGPYSLSVPSIIALTSITGAVQLRPSWQWRTSDRRAGPSGSADAAHPHTLALVVACAFSIEQTLRSYHQSHFMKAAADGLQDRFSF